MAQVGHPLSLLPSPIQSHPSRRLKVLLVAHKFPPFMGGIETHTFEVGRRMASRGHAVTVLTGDPFKQLPKDETIHGMHVRRVPVYPKSSDIFFAPTLHSEFAEIDCDIAHIQGFHTFVPPHAMLACIRRKIPYVLTFHSGGHSSRLRNAVRGAQRALLRPLLVKADKLIAVSEFEARHFAAGLRIDREQIAVVPNGAEIEAASERDAAKTEAPLILTIGRLEKYKGHHKAIAAFAAFKQTYPTATLHVLGEGPYKTSLIKLVQSLGLNGSVNIGGIPPKERSRMGELMSRASLVLLLSDYEAHPVAALEAISLGRPVLASNSTGFQEMEAKGLLRGIDPNASPALVARAMAEEIAKSPLLRRPFALNSWDDCARDLLDIYDSVKCRDAASRLQTSLIGDGRPSYSERARNIGA
jgi:glycosyltransferase involved in cell wall biosynthesis